jgi:hypothetical protein
VNTGGTALIEALLDRFGPALWPDVEALLNGGTVRAALDENLVFATCPQPRRAVVAAPRCGLPQALHTELRRGRFHAELVIPTRSC